MGKLKTQAQLDRAADLRMQKTYGRDLAWYEEQFELQGRHCAICPDGPKTRRLHIDHDHHYVDVKIKTFKEEAPYLGSWAASGLYNFTEYTGYGPTKSAAIRMVKDKLKAASVRGLLCHRCNRAMILFKDKSYLLRKAADYLDEFSPLSGRKEAA
jgi:hypothetical protein